MRAGYESGTNLAKMNTKQDAFFSSFVGLFFCFFDMWSLCIDQQAASNLEICLSLSQEYWD